MNQNDIRIKTLREAIVDVDDVFATKDIVEHPAVWDGHQSVRTEAAFPSMVGRQLQASSGSLGIRDTGQSGARGQIWEKK